LWCINEDGIDAACARAPAWMQSALPELKEAAKREFRDLWRRREEEEERSGYTALQNRSDEIVDIQVELIKRIERSNSPHPAVIATKIDLALSQAPKEDLMANCPWYALATVLRTLLPQLPADMAAVLTPAAEERGTIGQLFARQAEA
jgi:hypothetical protein